MKKKVILLVFAIFVVAVLAASVVFTAYWADLWYTQYLELSNLPHINVEMEFKFFKTFLIFAILQALALSCSIVGLVYIIKTDFTLSKQDREAQQASRREARKQAKKEKLQAKLDKLNQQ